MYETSNSALSSTSETNDGHTDKEKHKCDVCSKLFGRKFNLAKHKKIHTRERNHKCDVCSKRFRRKYDLEEHKKIYTNEKHHKCDVCAMLFRLKSNLVKHEKIHTNEKNHKCNVCSKLFRSNRDLVRHKETHTPEKKHKCDVCSKLFRVKSNLLRHTKLHTNEKRSYQCFECGKNFASRSGIINHLQLHKKVPLKCDKCKKVFISAVQLKNHDKEVHIKEKLFSCNMCAESFVEKRKFKSHIFIKHIHNDTERDVILQPYNNSVSSREAKSECYKESDMKSCNVVLERFQMENSGMMGINSSKASDNVDVMEVKVELEESKPFDVSIMYNEEDVKDGISLTNGRVISFTIDEVKQENCIVKLENYDDIESVWEEKLEDV